MAKMRNENEMARNGVISANGISEKRKAASAMAWRNQNEIMKSGENQQ